MLFQLWKTVLDKALAESRKLPVASVSLVRYVAYEGEFPTIQELLEGEFDGVVLSGDVT